MVMDSSKDGVAGRITIIAAATGILVTMLGGVFHLANEVSDVKALINANGEKLDRNCRVIVRLDAKLTSHLLGQDPGLTPQERQAVIVLAEQSC